MKKFSIILVFLLFKATYVSAGNTGSVEQNETLFSVGSLFSYTDFKFDSTTGLNFNRFQGHSLLASLGLGNVHLTPTWTAGVEVFKVKTRVFSNIFLNPGVPANAEQTIHNNTLFGHVLKHFRPYFFLDVAGGYGQNKVNSTAYISPGTPIAEIGRSTTTNNNWFTSLTALYTRPWKNFVLSANGRLLYSKLNSSSYTLSFEPTLPAQTIAPLNNKALFLMENAEIGYTFNGLTPFVNAGLLQVLSFSNSRPVIAAPINGILPQLGMNKDGYRLGGGLSMHMDQVTLRIEEQYYNSGSTYTSYQTLVGLRCMIS